MIAFLVSDDPLPLFLVFLIPLLRRRPNISHLRVLEITLTDARLSSEVVIGPLLPRGYVDVIRSVPLGVVVWIGQRETLKFLHDLTEFQLP
jgi:hypothetical protein